ncbi:sel1 repeat family protein, partial [Rhodocyclus tenuis]|uniref:tetratricopeptide repeat protein n=1 Tax=Rhodocyclus gracilis TaxID=2929842 RepID=UPI00135505D0
MKNWIAAALLAVLAGSAIAGYDEGLAAYEKNDFKTALREFRPMAVSGDARAQFALGVMYENGRGIAQDYKEAVRWYRLAAEQGDATAQYNLGVM